MDDLHLAGTVGLPGRAAAPVVGRHRDRDLLEVVGGDPGPVGRRHLPPGGLSLADPGELVVLRAGQPLADALPDRLAGRRARQRPDALLDELLDLRERLQLAALALQLGDIPGDTDGPLYLVVGAVIRRERQLDGRLDRVAGHRLLDDPGAFGVQHRAAVGFETPREPVVEHRLRCRPDDRVPVVVHGLDHRLVDDPVAAVDVLHRDRVGAALDDRAQLLLASLELRLPSRAVGDVDGDGDRTGRCRVVGATSRELGLRERLETRLVRPVVDRGRRRRRLPVERPMESVDQVRTHRLERVDGLAEELRPVADERVEVQPLTVVDPTLGVDDDHHHRQVLHDSREPLAVGRQRLPVALALGHVADDVDDRDHFAVALDRRQPVLDVPHPIVESDVRGDRVAFDLAREQVTQRPHPLVEDLPVDDPVLAQAIHVVPLDALGRDPGKALEPVAGRPDRVRAVDDVHRVGGGVDAGFVERPLRLEGVRGARQRHHDGRHRSLALDRTDGDCHLPPARPQRPAPDRPRTRFDRPLERVARAIDHRRDRRAPWVPFDPPGERLVPDLDGSVEVADGRRVLDGVQQFGDDGVGHRLATVHSLAHAGPTHPCSVPMVTGSTIRIERYNLWA
nr:hypothetical protein [Halosimplex litoreum]